MSIDSGMIDTFPTFVDLVDMSEADPSIDRGFIDMSFDPARPYNDLPALPPSKDVETKAVLKACVEARAALAELKISGQLIPNPSVLINSIPLLEARQAPRSKTLSRPRTGYSASPTGRKLAGIPRPRRRFAIAQRFTRASRVLKDQPLSTRSAIEICRTIKGVDLDIRATPGTALMNEATGRVVYTPPEGAELLRDKLANWERYIHADDGVDPLIRLAILHYQFEAIHPFTDGNGRTGRVLNLLFLVEQGLLDIPVLYLSRYIIDNKKAYYDGLLTVTTDGAWEPWILFMLAAIRETSTWSTAKIRAIRNLLDGTTDQIRLDLPKIYSRELAEIIFVNPYCRIADLSALASPSANPLPFI